MYDPLSARVLRVKPPPLAPTEYGDGKGAPSRRRCRDRRTPPRSTQTRYTCRPNSMCVSSELHCAVRSLRRSRRASPPARNSVECSLCPASPRIRASIDPLRRSDVFSLFIYAVSSLVHDPAVPDVGRAVDHRNYRGLFSSNRHAASGGTGSQPRQGCSLWALCRARRPLDAGVVPSSSKRAGEVLSAPRPCCTAGGRRVCRRR